MYFLQRLLILDSMSSNWKRGVSLIDASWAVHKMPSNRSSQQCRLSHAGYTMLSNPSSNSLQVKPATVTSLACCLSLSIHFLLCHCSIVHVIVSGAIALPFPVRRGNTLGAARSLAITVWLPLHYSKQILNDKGHKLCRCKALSVQT